MPDNNNETSIFRTSESSKGKTSNIINKNKIWEIGRILSKKRGISLKAKTDISSIDICKAGLKCVPDEPPYRHGLILNWKNDKADNIEIAKVLCESASLDLVP